MIFRQLFDHKSSTYTYLLGDENSGKAALIDPVLEKVEDYKTVLSNLKLYLEITLDTHTHADHITAQGTLRELYGCVTMMGRESESECISHTFTHQQIIQLGRITIQTLHTPGHTLDSYSFFVKENEKADIHTPMVFTGDTLLIRGTGRTDFQQGDAKTQFQSLNKILLTLPENTIVYPGHDYKGWTSSTIAEEKKHNPRLQFSTKETYAAHMASLNLPNPEMMDIAVPLNQACGKSDSGKSPAKEDK